MLSRLNLTSVNCNQLHLYTHVKLSSSVANTIFSETHVSNASQRSKTAIFGMFYHIGEITYTVRAYINRAEGQDYHVEFEYYDNRWPPLPKGMKPPQVLLDHLNPFLKDFVLYCDAYFTYSKTAVWKSAIELPIPLKPDKISEEFPFTHVEALRLGKLENDNELYSVQIQRSESGDIKHWVRFPEMVKANEVEENVAKQALAKSSSLSLLLMRHDKEKNGN